MLYVFLKCKQRNTFIQYFNTFVLKRIYHSIHLLHLYFRCTFLKIRESWSYLLMTFEIKKKKKKRKEREKRKILVCSRFRKLASRWKYKYALNQWYRVCASDSVSIISDTQIFFSASMLSIRSFQVFRTVPSRLMSDCSIHLRSLL